MNLRKTLAALLSVSMAVLSLPTSFVSTTTTTFAKQSDTAPAAEDFPKNAFRLTFKAIRSLTDEEYLKDDLDITVKDVNMHLDRIPISWSSISGVTQIGEPERLVDWNTSDVNPFVSDIYTSEYKNQYEYHLYSDDLGNRYYAESGGNKVDVSFFGGDKEYYAFFLANQYPDREYPISGTYSRTVRLVDSKTGEPVEDFDCELFEFGSDKVLYAWNTSKMPEMTFSDLKYEFADAWQGRECSYGIRLVGDKAKEYFFDNNTTLPSNYPSDTVFYLQFYQNQYTEGDISLSGDINVYHVPPIQGGYDGTTAPVSSTAYRTTTTTTAAEPTIETYFTGTHAYPVDSSQTTSSTAASPNTTTETTTASTNKSELTYTFRWTTPPIMEYTVGDELNFIQGLIQYYAEDENGNTVDYGHVPLYQLKTEHEPFTEPGDYEVKVYRQTNGELALTYTVHVSEKSDTQPPTTEPEPVSIGNGDANGDGQVTIADAAAILQYLGNTDKYPLSETGHRNADFDGKAGITTGDAIAIQKFVISAK